MIRYDCEQGTEEWKELRLGIPTASSFDKIISPVQLKRSKSRSAYLDELLAERKTGHAGDDFSTAFTERGTDLEAEAVRVYEFRHNVRVTRVGFITNDSGTAGGSPDGFVEDGSRSGGLEVKCFGEKHHTQLLRAAAAGKPIFPAKLTQVYGNLWLSERSFWDVFAWSPSLPPIRIRYELETAEALPVIAEAVLEFCAELETEAATLAALSGAGYDLTS